MLQSNFRVQNCLTTIVIVAGHCPLQGGQVSLIYKILVINIEILYEKNEKIYFKLPIYTFFVQLSPPNFKNRLFMIYPYFWKKFWGSY